MATIVLKSSSIAAKIPLEGDLVAGELAVNTTDEKIYIKNAGGTVVDIVASQALSDADIKAAYENNAETNAFTDSEKAALALIEPSATSDQSAAEILAALLTVDGSGSTLDADTLDTVHLSSLVRSDVPDTVTSDLTIDAAGSIAWATAPASANQLVNKAYVDSLVGGITWKAPVSFVNVIDEVAAEPSMVEGEGYLVNATATWSGTAVIPGDLIQVQSGSWVVIMNSVTEIAANRVVRYGISISHPAVAEGVFTGKDNHIVQLDPSWTPGSWVEGTSYDDITPTGSDAIFVEQELAYYFGYGYVYDAGDASWRIFMSPTQVGAGTGLSYVGNTLNVDDSYLKNTGDNINGDLLPQGTNVHDIGSAGAVFQAMYATTFYGESTSAQYADLAEIYSADAEIAPGTVVAFGGDAEVTTCNDDATSRVAGIVSTNPAFLMNAESDGIAIALRGRVPCKVSGSVKKGDMMVSNGNGGARAEANPLMGTVIGKALENSEGEAIIEIVVGG